MKKVKSATILFVGLAMACIIIFYYKEQEYSVSNAKFKKSETVYKELIDTIKSKIFEKSSFKHISTHIMDNEDGTLRLRMRYYEKDIYGRISTNTAIADLDTIHKSITNLKIKH